MDLEKQIRALQAAQGDPAKLALASVDLVYGELGEQERAALTECLEAAAMPHWCDPQILAATLQMKADESSRRLNQLSHLSILEPFPARGGDAMNVHEANRIPLRRWLAGKDKARFRMLSHRLVGYFRSETGAAGRIEWIYHLLCADPDRGAMELERLGREWASGGRPEDRYALAAALAELDKSHLVAGRAKVWVRLTMAWTTVSRGEAARLEEIAAEILAMAQSVSDPCAQADAEALVGQAALTKGKLLDAQTAYNNFLSIMRLLTEQDPTNAGWLRDLAVAHNKIGRVLAMQQKPMEAQAEFQEYLDIMRCLTEQDPTNAGWQRDLAIAYSCVGSLLQTQGKLSQAQVAFQEYLDIMRRLTDKDPNNAGWLRDLAVAHNKIGRVLEIQQKPVEAQAEFQEYLDIIRRLTEQDPTDAGWQRDLAMAYSCVGSVLQTQGKLSEAQVAFQEYLDIMRRLTEQDSTKAGWQCDLATAHRFIGGVLEAQDKVPEAQAAYQEYLDIMRRLTEQDPTNAGWQRDLATAYNLVGRVLETQGKMLEAEAKQEKYQEITQRLREMNTSNPG